MVRVAILERITSSNFLTVEWLGLGTFTARAQVQSLVGELRSHKSCSAAKILKKKKKTVRDGLNTLKSLRW